MISGLDIRFWAVVNGYGGHGFDLGGKIEVEDNDCGESTCV